MCRWVRPAAKVPLDYAIVVAAEVRDGAGILAGEPVTNATLRGTDGRERTVRIVGGPTKNGGFARLAGHVVPVLGARVRIDLGEDRSVTLLSSPIQAWAPNTPAGTWDPSKLPLVFDVALPVSRDLGGNAADDLEVAARTWGRPACTGFRARYGETKALVPTDDGTNGVFFHDDVWPPELVPGALAQTIVHVDGTGKLHDADIHVNGAAFRFSIDGTHGTQDIRSVLVHEIGHALGLGHSTDERATMNVSGSGLRWRSLEKDDVDGVCALYPGAGADGCESAPCPPNFACVAGACQRPGDRADVCSPCTPELGACEAAGDGARCIDIGTAGRACGRACATDRECGLGFACRPTTESGDLQCVSLSSCSNGANLCVTDVDCKYPGARCRNDACLGAVPTPDAGDASVPTNAGGPTDLRAGGNDCDCRTPPAPAPLPATGAVPLALLVLSLLRRRRD